MFRTTALLLVFCFVCANAFAQNVFIPDSSFRVFLQVNYPSCMTGDSLNSTCTEVVSETVLIIEEIDIYDLTGLEYFVGLEYLDCSRNEISELPAFQESLLHIDVSYNDLITLPPLPSGLVYLNSGSNSQIGELPDLPASLDTLYCYFNYVDSLPDLPEGLKVLNMVASHLGYLPELPESLEYLRCDLNDLTEMPELPTGLKHLNNSNNFLENSHPVLPEGLEYFNCRGNQWLVNLPALPSTLKTLYCGDMHLNTLQELPPTLEYLECNYNFLTVMPDFPQSLRSINFYSNQVTQVPQLPDSLETLVCFLNQIAELPDLPPTLTVLNVGRNILTELPPLPENLKELACDENLLTSLDPLPVHLEELYCGKQSIFELPHLPSTLKKLNCGYSNIYFMPTLPDSLEYLHCANTNIECLPTLPETLEDLIITNTALSCLPNHPPLLEIFQNPGLPICSVNQTHYCDYSTKISGRVYYDENENCANDSAEVGLQNRVIQGSFGGYTLSDSTGDYDFYVDTGLHTVIHSPPLDFWAMNCPGNPYTIMVDSLTDSIPNIDFPTEAPENCPWLWLDVGSNRQRPCFTDNVVLFYYCNLGTAVAEDAYVKVQFPTGLNPLTSSIPWIDLGNNKYRFELGDIGVDECGFFSVQDSVDCNSEIGSTVCIDAEILPASPCEIGGPNWDHASIDVAASCQGETSIDFVIQNNGTGNMATQSVYRVFENNALFQPDQPFQLNSNESLTIQIPATGNTYRLEADQVEDHPGNSHPRATVEGCGSAPYVLDQVMQTIQDDFDDRQDIECVVLTASYDPNDKTVVPAGVGEVNAVHPNDSILEYKIRFQNTGTDTAFTVVVIDTLPVTEMNPLTFRSGAASHPYSVSMHGNGIVTWTFENILLPDSATNEIRSNGFVNFEIHTQPNLPLGTVVNNRAAIYFDFNSAIYTENCFITISEEQLIVSNRIQRDDVDIAVQPNPFRTSTTLSFDRFIENGTIEILDALGRPDRSENFKGTSHELVLSDLKPGIYLLRVLDAVNLLGTERLSVIK